MQEINIDISAHSPVSIYQYRNQEFDYVVTLCDNIRTTAEEVLKGGDRFIHRNFVSPQEIGRQPEDTLEDYRRVRDEIGFWLEETFPQPLQDPLKGTGVNGSDHATTRNIDGDNRK
jgi:arsenate reductase